MNIWIRITFIAVILFSLFLFTMFLLSSTAIFQRQMDIVGTTTLTMIGIPVVILVGIFVTILIRGWKPVVWIDYVGICIGILVVITLSFVLLQSVNMKSWEKERVNVDTLKITDDGRYEYQLIIKNLFQKNVYTQLYLKDISSNEEMYIPINLKLQKLAAIRIENNHWVNLESRDNVSHYIFQTTKELGIPEEEFEVNIETKTARKSD